MQRILLISHFNFTKSGPIHGPTHSLCDYLKKKKLPYYLIAHPLYIGEKTYIETFDGGRIISKKVGNKNSFGLIKKSIYEYVLSSSLTQGQNFSLAIGVDPLSASFALILKLRRRVRKVIYYSVDYAINRFNNFITNFLYHLIDRLASYCSDRVWNVSTRIYERRLNMGLSKKKNVIVPNSTSFSLARVLPINRVYRFHVAIVSGKTHDTTFPLVLASIKSLLKKYKKIKLIVIGKLDKAIVTQIRKMGFMTRVELVGHIDHEAMLSVVARCGLGIALYTNDYPWTYFGDSMKARDYMAVGTPVIITDVVSTSLDIKKYKSGLIIKPTQKDLTTNLDVIFSSPKQWARLRDGAITCARDFDFTTILDREIMQYYDKLGF